MNVELRRSRRPVDGPFHNDGMSFKLERDSRSVNGHRRKWMK